MNAIANHIQTLERQLIEFGAHACVAFTKNLFRKNAPNSARVDLLMGVVRRVQAPFPQAALELIERLEPLSDQRDEMWTVQASILDRLGKQKDARNVAERVLLEPSSRPEYRLRAANLLVRFSDDPRIVQIARQAFEESNSPLRHASGLLYIALKAAEWGLAAQLTRQLEQAADDGLYVKSHESPRTHLLWCASERHNLGVLKVWAQRFGHRIKTTSDSELEPLQARRLRVGYLSSDFREHPTSRLVNGLLRHHDRTRLELFMYCSGWDDGSAMRKEVESHFEHIHSVSHLSDEQAALLIRGHAIDVLVELNGPTRANRVGVFAHHPAPVQIGYLGWPGSYGGGSADYIVADPYVVPTGVEKRYPEKVIRLNKTYQVNDYAVRAPLQTVTRSQCGLPEDENICVLGMFNAINKVRGDVWAVWMEIMKAVPNAILWMLDPGKTARMNIAQTTRSMGVDPKRIWIAPPIKQDGHLARLQCCDLILDPWPYGGHTSTADALFAGVPVIALEGTNFAGRVNGSLLHAAGLGDLVRPDTEAYVRAAVSLLRNTTELGRLKQYIKTAVPRSDVFNAKAKARQLEQAYLAAYQRKFEGAPAIHINFK